MQCVSHSVGLCVQIARIVAVGLNFASDVLDNFEAVALEADALDGVICDEAHLVHAYLTQNLGPDAIISFVGFKA